MNKDAIDSLMYSVWNSGESKNITIREIKPTTLKIEPTPFFDEEMLSILLKDKMEEIARETDEQLARIEKRRKKEMVDNVSSRIKAVHFNNPYTIIIWKDGQVTRVKCQDGDVYDKEKGFAIALCKYFLGNTNYFNTIFKNFLSEKDK